MKKNVESQNVSCKPVSYEDSSFILSNLALKLFHCYAEVLSLFIFLMCLV